MNIFNVMLFTFFKQCFFQVMEWTFQPIYITTQYLKSTGLEVINKIEIKLCILRKIINRNLEVNGGME